MAMTEEVVEEKEKEGSSIMWNRTMWTLTSPFKAIVETEMVRTKKKKKGKKKKRKEERDINQHLYVATKKL